MTRDVDWNDSSEKSDRSTFERSEAAAHVYMLGFVAGAEHAQQMYSEGLTKIEREVANLDETTRVLEATHRLLHPEAGA